MLLTRVPGSLKRFYSPTSLSPSQGRLTLQTLTPVMTATQAAKTTIYYTPYAGNLVPLYNGTNFVMTSIGAEISVATTDATKSPAAIGVSKVNDWFVWNDAGTIRLGHGPDWTSDIVRSAGTALVMVNGILLNNASLSPGPAAQRGTYVGTTRSNGSSQLDYIFGTSASGGTAAFFGVWNTYNRVSTGTIVLDTGVPYTYSSGTIRQARASAGNQVSFVLGLQEDSVNAVVQTEVRTVAAVGANATIGLGLNSTTAYIIGRAMFLAGTANNYNMAIGQSAALSPGIGVNVVSANEGGDAVNANTFNNIQAANLSVMLRN